MVAHKDYPWHFTFDDGSTFDLSEADREDLLVKIREAVASDKDEVKIETRGFMDTFCEHVYGNQSIGRISAILKAALPSTWRRYNMSYGTLEMGKFGSGLKLKKLDPKHWTRVTYVPGAALEECSSYDIGVHLRTSNPHIHGLRMARFAQPSVLQPGDILATGDIVLSPPRITGDGRFILLHLPGGFEGYWEHVSPQIPVALLVEGDEGYEALKEQALQARNQFIENTAI